MRRYIGRLMLAAGVILIMGLAALAGVIVAYGATDRARPADVIVVLGGSRPAIERRVQHAVKLYEAGYAPYILCAGGVMVREGVSEARQCADDAERRGVPAEAIVLEASSHNTWENAEACARVMDTYGWDDAVLVTDDFHLWRANWMFRDQGVTVWPSPAQATGRGLSMREEVFSVARELGATVWTVCYVFFTSILCYLDAGCATLS
ncbi:MAG TPA: YdcF family protein [Aggregatilineaceae bacterium]|nr:YdcF family protein [Aggregatilineaceae bacterium]